MRNKLSVPTPGVLFDGAIRPRMKIRGDRECQECGTRWSYYDTGEITCPECGSVRSLGVDEDRKLHTDAPASFDLSSVRTAFANDELPLEELAEEAASRCRAFTRKRGFVRGGELRNLDETYLAAEELRHAMGEYARSLSTEGLDSDPDDAEGLYLLSLLRGADRGERPESGAVPRSMRAARGLAVASAVDAYRKDAVRWLDDREREEPAVRRVLGRLADHVKRIRALDGEVDPDAAERVVEAAREVGRYLRADDEVALARAEERLETLDDSG